MPLCATVSECCCCVPRRSCRIRVPTSLRRRRGSRGRPWTRCRWCSAGHASRSRSCLEQDPAAPPHGATNGGAAPFQLTMFHGVAGDLRTSILNRARMTVVSLRQKTAAHDEQQGTHSQTAAMVPVVAAEPRSGAQLHHQFRAPGRRSPARFSRHLRGVKVTE